MSVMTSHVPNANKFSSWKVKKLKRVEGDKYDKGNGIEVPRIMIRVYMNLEVCKELFGHESSVYLVCS